jgi:NADPH:quinone reductase-like Zn-dependent oxidoreductase
LRAAVINKYGSASELQVQEIPTPAPSDIEILVKVECASINPVDYKMRRGDLKLIFGNNFPRVLGVDFAGVIAETGKFVTAFKPGDIVFGMSSPLHTRFGTYAEYTLTRPDSLALTNPQLPAEHAASIPVAGLTALETLKYMMQLRNGDSVLINGASGGVGSFAVQIAKALGVKVYATCSADNLEFVRSLGADEVCDYKQTDVSQLKEKFNGIFDASAKLKYSKVKHLLTSNGMYVTTLPDAPAILATAASWFTPKKCRIVMVGTGRNVEEELSEFADLVLRNKVRPIIGKTIPLSAVAETHALAEQGHARGKTVIMI